MGIGIETGPLYEVLSHVYDNNGDIRHVVLLFYICRIIDGRPQPLDCRDLIWADEDMMKSLAFVEGDIPLVDLLLSDSGIWEITS
jgi:hypothetical protein